MIGLKNSFVFSGTAALVAFSSSQQLYAFQPLCHTEVSEYVATPESEESFIDMLLCFQLTEWNSPHGYCEEAAIAYSTDPKEEFGRGLEACLSAVNREVQILSIDPVTKEIFATVAPASSALDEIIEKIREEVSPTINDEGCEILHEDGTTEEVPCE